MKSNYLHMRISEKDKERLNTLAEANDQTISEYIRELIYKEYILFEQANKDK